MHIRVDTIDRSPLYCLVASRCPAWYAKNRIFAFCLRSKISPHVFYPTAKMIDTTSVFSFPSLMPVCRRFRLTFFAVIFAAVFIATAQADDRTSGAGNWPQWRGAHEDGTSRAESLPLNWNEAAADEKSDKPKIDENILWKCDLPEWGRNTPVIWGGAIFLTSHIADIVLAKNRLNDETFASPIVSEGKIYIRGQKRLYCLAEMKN